MDKKHPKSGMPIINLKNIVSYKNYNI